MFRDRVKAERTGATLVFFALLAFEEVRGQVVLSVEPERSLVWWQLDPHFGHLWGTTCPNEPSWQAGEGRSPGFYVNARKRPAVIAKEEETVPLYPRLTVRPLCRRAVRGTFTAGDSIHYSGLKGYINVAADSIATGADVRDDFSRRYVFKSSVFSQIRFQVDSLSRVTQTADTAAATVYGTFEFRGVEQKVAVPVQLVPHPPGRRVRGQFSMPASALRDTFDVSEIVLGAGLGLRLWDTLHIGFDLVLSQTGSN